mmetsp:Transcript_9854/g.20992  ORF Transcript_9854/g.20992 Transcript_9854/m.20992 type:complete len:122 (-) Transcript_9854:8-373(-)
MWSWCVVLFVMMCLTEILLQPRSASHNLALAWLLRTLGIIISFILAIRIMTERLMKSQRRGPLAAQVASSPSESRDVVCRASSRLFPDDFPHSHSASPSLSRFGIDLALVLCDSGAMSDDW